MKLLLTITVGSVCTAVTRVSEVVSIDGSIFSCTGQPLVPSAVGETIGYITEVAAEAPRPLGAFDGWRERVGAGEQSDAGDRKGVLVPITEAVECRHQLAAEPCRVPARAGWRLQHDVDGAS
ncbi:hypothetical protein [Streptacidiphilus sp. PAMC 29251]